jgi:hypothetical protein
MKARKVKSDGDILLSQQMTKHCYAFEITNTRTAQIYDLISHIHKVARNPASG